VRELLATVHGLPSAYDAAVYAAFALAARVMRAPAGGATVWERDLSTRVDSMRGAS
jgi:hypothetical protein